MIYSGESDGGGWKTGERLRVGKEGQNKSGACKYVRTITSMSAASGFPMLSAS